MKSNTFPQDSVSRDGDEQDMRACLGAGESQSHIHALHATFNILIGFPSTPSISRSLSL